MKKEIGLIGIILALLFLLSKAHATIWYVHPDSLLNSIQAGLDSCSLSDTVLVAPGTYTETITWPSVPRIKLMSEFGPNVTNIDADLTGRVINMAQGLTRATIIDGFTIMHGWAEGPSECGGGIRCFSTSPTIRNNIIENNTAPSFGGGIYCSSGAPHIIGNIIQYNTSSYGGGGLSCSLAEPVIQENYFFENGRTNDGGAIYCYQRSPTIQYNTILKNYATYGGGLHCSEGSQPLTLYNNISANEFWGIYNAGSYTVPAENNWWGDSTGPDGSIYGPVDYIPWLIEEINFDIAVISIESPPDTVTPSATYTPRVTVRNNCNFACSALFFTAKCTINGYQDYVRIDQPLAQGSTIEVIFADWTVPTQDRATYQMTVALSYFVDQIPINDTIYKQITHVIDEREVFSPPLSFILAQNYPNPFNPITQIRYALPKDCQVKLEVYNVIGQKVSTLVDGKQKAGYKTVRWDAGSLSSGIYFYRLQAGDFVQTRKMVVLR